MRVGYQNRDDTYSGRLAYITYYDVKGKLRKQQSWEGWPSTCKLAGIIVWSEINLGRDPCAGCNYSRQTCKGRPATNEPENI